jgi:hypothetical protein
MILYDDDIWTSFVSIVTKVAYSQRNITVLLCLQQLHLITDDMA